MMLLLALPAFAARVYWTDAPSEADTAAAARTVPEATFAGLDTLLGGGTSPAATDPALGVLRTELAETTGMLDVFDGELQIMGRLQKAVADVRIVRSIEERDLVWKALLLQGYAVQRYFQDKLLTDPAAAPYRDGATIAAWGDAAALVGAPVPSAQDLPDTAARVAYDAVQASARGMPSITFVVGPLGQGARVWLDGRPIEGRVLATPGRHYVHVEAGGIVLQSRAEDFAAGATVELSAPFGPAERDQLLTLARNAEPGWSVPPPALEWVRAQGEPVYLAVPRDGEPTLLRLDSGTATRVRLERDERSGDGLQARAGVGMGWASSADWFVQNVAEGAPHDRSTVNAAAPAVSLGGGWRRGLLYAGAGLDVAVPTGEHHDLPSGDGRVRALVHPHVDVGLPWAQLTVGPQFPWYLGLGAQATVPVAGPVELFGRGVWGMGLNQEREDGPAFEPADTWSAWAGAAVRLGG